MASTRLSLCGLFSLGILLRTSSYGMRSPGPAGSIEVKQQQHQLSLVRLSPGVSLGVSSLVQSDLEITDHSQLFKVQFN